jgi:hypothetical protein
VEAHPEDVRPGFLVAHGLPGLNLAEALFDLGEEAKALHGVLDRRILWEDTDRIQDPFLGFGSAICGSRFLGVRLCHLRLTVPWFSALPSAAHRA